MKQVRALKGHSARVSALAWSGTTLSSGGRDSNIINHDVRCTCTLSAPFMIGAERAPFSLISQLTLSAPLESCLS